MLALVRGPLGGERKYSAGLPMTHLDEAGKRSGVGSVMRSAQVCIFPVSDESNV